MEFEARIATGKAGEALAWITRNREASDGSHNPQRS